MPMDLDEEVNPTIDRSPAPRVQFVPQRDYTEYRLHSLFTSLLKSPTRKLTDTFTHWRLATSTIKWWMWG